MPEHERTRTLHGRVIHRGDDDYESARLGAVWNARKPERYPDVIVIAETEDDVVRAVQHAIAEGLPVGVRSGGHSWVGNGVRDGGMLVDLSHLSAISIDADARTVEVQPSAKGPDINAALNEHGLFFPTGHAPTVGVGGFLLGGGYGWNSRLLGPACLSIRAIDAVLADGTLVHADDESHPDLMWAARGSGPGFFAIVTKFYLTAYPLASQILRTVHTYSGAIRDEVLSWSYENLDSLSKAVEISVKAGSLAGTDQQVVSLTATAFCTDETGYDLLAALEGVPFRSQALRAVVNEPTSIPELYDIADRLNPAGLRWALDGIWIEEPVEQVIEAAAPLLDSMPPGPSFVLWMLWGHYPEQPNACWSSQARLYLSPNAGWTDPADDLEYETWAHLPLERIQSLSQGLQFSDNNLADRFDDGVSPVNAQRIERIRGVYDPNGLFHSYMAPGESTTAYAQSRRQ